MSVSEYQKLYNQAMEAYKKNKSRVSTAAKNTSKTTTTKSTSNKKENVLTKKNNSVTKEDAERILANSSNINKQVSSMGVAQPDYENERFSKSQADKIIEEGQQALKERQKSFDEWYTEDKKDMLFNADGTYRDLRAELDDFKAKSNTWQMTAKERHEYNAYKKELETAIEHSDYLQSRDKEKTLSTAEEKKDFYLMQDAYNDTFGEKALKKLSKVTGTIANMPFQAFDVVNDFVNPNFDINNPNNVSNVIYDALNKSEEQIQYGSGDVEQFALNSLEGVADFGAHFLLGMATGVSPIISMGAKSGLSKYSQNRKEGYDEMTSLGNAVLTGTMTLLTEKIGVDNFTNIITSGLGQFSIGALVSQSLGEGLEEGIEYLTEPLIDFATLGKNVDYKAGELFMSVALGMSSGAILGATGNTISAVKTRKTANQLKADMQVLTDYANKNTLNNTEASVINQALRLGNNALAKFENASVIGDAIQFESDKVKKMSMEEIRQNLYAFMQPQIDAERNTYNERMAVQNIINNAQQVLNNKGIRMDALQYSNLDEKVREQVDKTQKFANDLKVNVRFDSQAVAENGETVDGYYDNSTGEIVVNPEVEQPALTTFVHELTHGTETSKVYSQLQNLVKESVGEDVFNESVKNVKERYKKVVDLTDEGAAQEYVAIYLQEKLGNENFVKRLVKYDTSLASRIYEKVKRLVSTTNTAQDIEYAFMKAFRDSGVNPDLKKTLQYSYSDYENKVNNKETAITPVDEANNIYHRYSEKDIERMWTSKRILIEGVHTDLKTFLENAISGKLKGDKSKTLYLGKVGDTLNNKVKYAGTIEKDILNYNFSIDSNRIDHSENNHTKNEKEELRGQRILNIDDYLKIPRIIADPRTEVSYIGKDKQTNDTYQFVLKEGNDTYTVLNFVGNKRKIFSFASMYINEKKNPATASTSSNEAVDPTSKTARGTGSNNNIQNNSKNNKYSIGLSSQDLSSMSIMQKTKEQRRVLNEIESKDISLLDKSIEILTYLHDNRANMTQNGIKRFEDTINAHGAGFDTPSEYKYYRELSYENTSVEELESMLEEHRKLKMEYELSGGMQMKNSDLTRERYIVDRINDEINKAKNEELELKGRQPLEEKPLTTEQQLMINRLGNIEYKMLNGRYRVEAYNKNGNTEANSNYDPDYLAKVFGTKIANQIITTATSRNNKITEFDTDTSFMTDEYINNIVNKAKKRYGTTTNPTEAGYMTLDGKWLDFSGKREGGPSNVRNMDHVEIDIDGVDATDFIKMGNIRLQPETNGFQLLKEPTEKQKASLTRYLNSVHGNDEGYFIGFVDENKAWNTVDSLEFDINTSPKTIMNAIDNHFKNKKVQYSIGLTKDNLGRNLSEEQKNYFANTKVKDENGNLQVMYRGGNEEINVFDNKKSRASNLYGRGFYFTADESHASQYGQARPYYLNIENPLSLDDHNISKDEIIKLLQAIEDDGEDYDLSNYGYGANPESIADEIYGKSDFDMLQDISATAVGDLVYTTKWFNELNGTNYDGFILPTETVVFDSNQIKNVDNTTPTTNKDIRYSVGLSMENIKNNKPLEDLKTKYSDLNPTLIDKAVEEVQRQGYVSEVTKGALKDELKTFFGDEHIFENNPKARNRINEFINETIEEFATKIRYESDDKYANSVASKTNKILKGYENATSEDIENLYDNVSTIKNADALLKERRDLRLLDHTNLVEMLLFKGKDAKGYMSQLERVMDKIADGDIELRNELREKIEYPRFQAQIQYKELLEKYNTTVKEIVASGIREGSKESKAVQWLMEKQREDGSPYTNADLLKEFGYKMKNGMMAYENIENAAKLLRRDYDEIYNLINNIRESIYGDVELRNQLETEELQAKVKLAEETKNATKLAFEKNPSEQTQRVFAAANNDFNRLNRQLEAKRKDDASGDSTRRQKLKRRDNYAHHTFERESIILNLIKGYAGVKEVPTKLAGVSDYAQPKTGYASFFKKRLDGKYEADALKGFAEYMQDASRIIAYDPLIEYYRDFLSVMRNTAQDDNMSQFTRYMTNYVNALAGKTVGIDRWAREIFGDKLYGVFKEINSRVKANAILGNLRTAVTQFANAPMAAGMLVKNGGAGAVQDLTKGAFNYLTSIVTGKGDNSYLSPFVQVRTFDVDTNAIGVRAKVDEMFNFLLSKGDEIVTKMVWNAAYEQGKRKGVDSPVFYADDLTRRTVAGRSVGEVPLNLQSQVMNFIMPFQVETTNTMNNFIDMAKDPKSWGALLVTLIADFFFNELFEEMTGSRPLFDPIDVIRDAIKNEEDIATTSRHMLGEVAGATPYGSMIPAFTGMDSYDTKKWFGDNDPSRYGTGNIGASAITNIFTSVIEGKPLDAISDTVANFVLPGGGKQLQRSVEALQTNGILPQYVNGEWVFSPAYHKSNGDVAYETVPEQILDNASNLGNFAKQVAFGKWAGNEAQEYLNGSSSSQTSSKAQKIIDWFTSKDETVSKNDAVAITEEIEQARDSFTSSNTKGEFIEWMEGKDYSSEQKNMIFDTYYGDSKQIMNLNNFATSTGLSTSQTYDVKKIILTAEGKKAANKIDTITNSKALEVRKKLDEIGLYDEYLNYVLDNDLDLSSMGLNKKVAKMTNEEFESEYSNIFGTSYKTKTDEKSLSDIYAEVMNSSKSKKSSTSKTKDDISSKIKKIDSIVNKARTSSSTTSDSKVDGILEKLKNSSSNNSTAKATNSELLKRYLKEHAYDTALFN